MVVHTPFCKLAQKAHAWLHHADSLGAQGVTGLWQALHKQVRTAEAYGGVDRARLALWA